MNDSSSPSPATLARCRAEARRLIKHLRGSDPARAHAAAARLARLRSLALTATDLDALRARARLKHALALVAEEHGASSWNELRQRFEVGETAPPSFHTPRLDGLLNCWFVDRGEARAYLREHGGYLLPFREQCFVTDCEGILELGLDPADPDWVAVGFDLVTPGDPDARARLCARRRAAIAAGIGLPTPERRR